MHTIVEIIPLLLHASLLLFFGGLVAFLVPINVAIAAVAAALLSAVVVVYSALTLLPLWSLDCPYRTPLSTTVWRISQSLLAIWRQCREAPDVDTSDMETETMVEAMSHQAMEASRARTVRDYRALVWTVRSLADDIELEPFVEALPDLLWGPASRRYTYEEHIQKLIRTPELQLQSRIAALLRSCDDGLLTPEGSRRRRITCYKALWAIASMQPPRFSSYPESLDFTAMAYYCQTRRLIEATLPHYSISVATLMRWSTFCSIKSHLAALLDHLVQCDADIQAGLNPDLHPVTSYLESSSLSLFPVLMNDRLRQYVSNPTTDNASLSIIIPEFVEAIKTFCIHTPYEILVEYLADSAMQESPPYRWHDTQRTISLDGPVPFSAIKGVLHSALTRVIHRIPERPVTAPEDWNWNDAVVERLCSFWKPAEPVPIPDSIIYFLNHRNSDAALANLLRSPGIGIHLWASFPITLWLAQGPSMPQFPLHVGIDKAKTALWCLAWITSKIFIHPPAVYEPVLYAVERASNSSPITVSVTAMIKSQLLSSLPCFYEPPCRAQVPPLKHSLLPMETAISVPPEFLDTEIALSKRAFDSVLDGPPDAFQQVLRYRIIEAKISLIAEFLDGFASDSIPYKATKTLRSICGVIPSPHAEIHASHQIRFANGMHHILDLDHPDNMELLDVIIDSTIFELYFETGQSLMSKEATFTFQLQRHAWLQDLSARTQIKDTLTDYMNKFASSPNSFRIRAILEGLEYLHPTE
jgi:hypothetical protein